MISLVSRANKQLGEQEWDPTVKSACLGTVRLGGVEMKSWVLAKENCNKKSRRKLRHFS